MGEQIHLGHGPGQRRGASSRGACPNPAHDEGKYQQAEREVKQNYSSGGIWPRGKVGLGRTSLSLAPWQVAGGGLRRVRPPEIVIIPSADVMRDALKQFSWYPPNT